MDRYSVEKARFKKAKAEAIERGLELLTPKAAKYLFSKKSESTIQKARLADPHVLKVSTSLHSRPVDLLFLRWAVETWGKPSGFDARLAELRANATTFGVDWAIYLVLHTEPIVMSGPDANIGAH